MQLLNILDVPTSYEAKGSKKFVKEGTIEMLESYMTLLDMIMSTLHTPVEIEGITKPFIHR